MPGIFGLIKNEKYTTPIEYCIDAMSKLLRHKPWYLSDLYCSNNFAYGSIHINSPFKISKVLVGSSEYLLMIDGFIYSVGDRAIKSFNDKTNEIPEAIANLFIDDGYDAFSKISGNYTIAIQDFDAGKLVLFNDRIGARRFYYSDLPECFAFSPEMKAIRFLPKIQLDLDWKSISDFLNYGMVIGDATFYRPVKSLSSASYIEYNFNSKHILVKKYWRPIYTANSKQLDTISDEVYAAFDKSLSEKLAYSESIICPISGGLDSRLVLGALQKRASDQTIDTVTYGQKTSWEYKYAKKVCAALDIENHKLAVIGPKTLMDYSEEAVWLSEGMTSIAVSHLLLIPGVIENRSGTVFNGIFGGPTNYDSPYYRIEHINSSIEFSQKVRDIKSSLLIDRKFYKQMLNQDIYSLIDKHSASSIAAELQKQGDVSDLFCNQRDAFFIENRMRRRICQGSLYRFFWEEQLPLTDYLLYDLYLSIPPDIKHNKKLLKAILTFKFPKLAKITDSNTGVNCYRDRSASNLLSMQFQNKLRYYVAKLTDGNFQIYDKSGYAHYTKWFQSDAALRKYFHNYMHTDAIKKLDFFDYQNLSEVMANAKKTGLSYGHLERLVTFCIWCNLFKI